MVVRASRGLQVVVVQRHLQTHLAAPEEQRSWMRPSERASQTVREHVDIGRRMQSITVRQKVKKKRLRESERAHPVALALPRFPDECANTNSPKDWFQAVPSTASLGLLLGHEHHQLCRQQDPGYRVYPSKLLCASTKLGCSKVRR